MTQIPPPSFRVRNNKVSIKLNSESKFFIMDPGSLPFVTRNGHTYYVIKEYELGVVNDKEINPLRMIHKGKLGDYLFVTVTGDLAIMSAEKAKALLGI